jgi:uncharacterized membrane protein (GlpM family)
MDLKLLPVYFILGGAVVTAVTYFGSQARGALAAFFALLPSISVITLCTIYINAGLNPTLSYVKNLLILLPPWVVYVLGLIFLLPRVGPVWALIVSIAAYLLVSFLILHFFHIEL